MIVAWRVAAQHSCRRPDVMCGLITGRRQAV